MSTRTVLKIFMTTHSRNLLIIVPWKKIWEIRLILLKVRKHWQIIEPRFSKCSNFLSTNLQIISRTRKVNLTEIRKNIWLTYIFHFYIFHNSSWPLNQKIFLASNVISSFYIKNFIIVQICEHFFAGIAELSARLILWPKMHNREDKKIQITR